MSACLWFSSRDWSFFSRMLFWILSIAIACLLVWTANVSGVCVAGDGDSFLSCSITQHSYRPHQLVTWNVKVMFWVVSVCSKIMEDPATVHHGIDPRSGTVYHWMGNGGGGRQGWPSTERFSCFKFRVMPAKEFNPATVTVSSGFQQTDMFFSI